MTLARLLAFSLLATSVVACIDADPETETVTSDTTVGTVGTVGLVDATDSINWSSSVTGGAICPLASGGVAITSCYVLLKKGETSVGTGVVGPLQWSYAFVVWNRQVVGRVFRFNNLTSRDFHTKLATIQAIRSSLIDFDTGSTGTGTSGIGPHNPHPNGDGGLHLVPGYLAGIKGFANQVADVNANAQAYAGP